MGLGFFLMGNFQPGILTILCTIDLLALHASGVMLFNCSVAVVDASIPLHSFTLEQKLPSEVVLIHETGTVLLGR